MASLLGGFMHDLMRSNEDVLLGPSQRASKIEVCIVMDNPRAPLQQSSQHRKRPRNSRNATKQQQRWSEDKGDAPVKATPRPPVSGSPSMSTRSRSSSSSSGSGKSSLDISDHTKKESRWELSMHSLPKVPSRGRDDGEIGIDGSFANLVVSTTSPPPKDVQSNQDISSFNLRKTPSSKKLHKKIRSDRRNHEGKHHSRGDKAWSLSPELLRRRSPSFSGSSSSSSEGQPSIESRLHQIQAAIDICREGLTVDE